MTNTDMASPVLAANDLSFSYQPGHHVMDGWSGSFDRGTMTAITGPSGCGKSTLLFLMSLMLKPQAGQIWLGGRRVDNLPDSQRCKIRAESFGFVFQDATLNQTRTVLDNVIETALYRQVAKDDYLDRARQLLTQFGVDLPPERKPTQVSGGQALRIALCRALLFPTDVLFADEPTGNLDPATGQTVIAALAAQAHAGTAVIIVTHSPWFAQVCDQQIQL